MGLHCRKKHNNDFIVFVPDTWNEQKLKILKIGVKRPGHHFICMFMFIS